MKSLAFTVFFAAPLLAAPTPRPLPALGWAEHVAVTLTDATGKTQTLALDAKVDTGAKSSSLHATGIKVVRRDGRDVVRFRVSVGGKSVEAEAPLAKEAEVKSSDGEGRERYFVEIPVCVGGDSRRALVSLADRGSMQYPMLLGRRFLEDRFLVDVGSKFLSGEARCR